MKLDSAAVKVMGFLVSEELGRTRDEAMRGPSSGQEDPASAAGKGR